MNRGADHVMRALAAHDVKDVFTLSGNQIMPLFDASLDVGIRLYHTRHEAAAAYMAEGYAQISGRVGVALVTAGAGLANAVGPLLTARESDTPVLLLSGDSPTGKDGQGAFQEMDQVAVTGGLTKWSVRPTSAHVLGETISEAIQVAKSGRPGPVHVALPADVLTEESDAFASSPQSALETAGAAPLRDWVMQAHTPLIVLGPELSNTRAPGLGDALSHALGAPVISMESPRGLNDPALGAVSDVFAQADRIVLLGKALDFTVGFGDPAPQARWAIVHGDDNECARARRAVGPRLDLVIEVSARAIAEPLTQETAPNPRTSWCQEAHALIAKRMTPSPSGAELYPDTLCTMVQAELDKHSNPILVCDGGEFGQWAQAGLTAPRRIINGMSGAIGGGLCYAMAARAADPTSPVFALMGDGTIGFHLAEFETAVREDLPFIAIVGNDQRWNAEHQIQLRDFGETRLHSCALSDARYDAAVDALGGFGAFVDTPEALPDALAAAVASGKPACINVQMTGLPAPIVKTKERSGSH